MLVCMISCSRCCDEAALLADGGDLRGLQHKLCGEEVMNRVGIQEIPTDVASDRSNRSWVGMAYAKTRPTGSGNGFGRTICRVGSADGCSDVEPRQRSVHDPNSSQTRCTLFHADVRIVCSTSSGLGIELYSLASHHHDKTQLHLL